MKNINLTWIIAHEPAYLFYRVAADFAKIVNEKSKYVQIKINIITADEYNQLNSSEDKVTKHNLWKLLQNNKVQIAQMQTTSLARQFNKQMHVFDLPYLFNDHDHAAEVLEGKIGTDLLNKFDKKSKLKGLAYTYSGGFRLMPLAEKVTSLEELCDKPMRSGMSEIAQETISCFGFKPVPTEVEELTSTVINKSVLGGEHVAQRLLPDKCESWTKTIIDTEHSLFLTSIVVNIDWWNSLSDDLQLIFIDSAREAARNERKLSLFEGEKSIKQLESIGVSYIKLTDLEKKQLKSKTEKVYEKFSSLFDSTLINSITKN